MEPTNQNTQNSTSHHKKVFSSILIILLCLILIYSVPSLGKIKLSAFNEGIKISSIDDVCNIYSKIDLKIHTKPSDFKISKSNFVISGGSFFEENNSFYFVASEPGIYSIKIKYKQIESNELQLEFVNPIEIERKDLEQEFFYFKKDQEDFEQKVEELDEREKVLQEREEKIKEKEGSYSSTDLSGGHHGTGFSPRPGYQSGYSTDNSGTSENSFSTSTGTMVWISESGSKYHNKSNCGRMNPDTAYQMSQSEAEAARVFSL